MRSLQRSLVLLVLATIVAAAPGSGAELYIGVAEADITHALPIALWGQMHTRVSSAVDNPITAQVVALESRDGDRSLDSAIMVTCDIVAIPNEVLAALRQRVSERLPDFDAELFVSGTHTHTGPVLEEGLYTIPKRSSSRRQTTSRSSSTAFPKRSSVPGTGEIRERWPGSWRTRWSARTAARYTPMAAP